MKHRLSALFMAGAIAVTMPVCADISIDSIDVSSADSTIKVTGKSDEINADILVTASSKTASESEFFDRLGYQDMIKSGEDGSFEITFKIDAADVYTFTAATENENAKKDFSFTSKAALDTAVATINSSTSLATDLKANKLELGLVIDGVEAEPNWNALADRIKLPINSSNTEETVLSLQRELIYQYIEDEKIENIFESNKYLDVFSMPNNAVLEDILSEENELYVTELISGEDIKDYNELTSKITEAMILAVVNDPNGYGNLKDTLAAHAGLIGINTSGVKEQVYKDLCNKTFSSLNELKVAFNNLTYYDDGGSGGGKGSGGGGSSLGGGKVNFAATPVTPGTNPVQSTMFNDLGNYAWAKDSVEKLAKLGIVSGRGNGNFAPADNITRSEFVKMIVLALDIKASDKEIAFDDVKESGWDYSYIKAAFSAGIINGVNDTYFGGNEKISRQDMAVIISRALSYAGRGVNSVSNEKFVDDTYIATYSRDAVYALRQAGVMQGDDLGRFNPLNPANRAEAAKVICSVLN